MTRRERLESKVEKRRRWADKQRSKSEVAFKRADEIGKHIPFGQPILVGHHSEKGHRRDLSRIESGIRQGAEAASMARHHDSKADGLEAQLESSIYSDDLDAVEALEMRIGELEAKAARWKAENAAFKKGDEAFAAELGITLERAAELRAKIMAGYSWCRLPHPSFSMANLRANIRRLQKRIPIIKQRQARSEAAASSETGVVIVCDETRAQITFAEKPDRSILNGLKAAGFYWSNGSWFGTPEAIPDSIRKTGEDANEN